MDDRSGLWRSLPIDVQERIDAELRRHRLLPPIVVLRDQAGLDPKPGLHLAQEVVVERLRWLTEHGHVKPEPAVTIEDLLGKAAAINAPIAAVEAVWDGDTQGWFVELLAIAERPSQRHLRFDQIRLAILRHGGDIRLFNGTVPPWPEATNAAQYGNTLAQVLGVPFYFASATAPDDQATRWWDQGSDSTASGL